MDSSKKTSVPEPIPVPYVNPNQHSTYDVKIDFDASTAGWMRNKVRHGPCMSYRCRAVKSNGTPCKKRAMEQKLTLTPQPHLCSSHIYTWRMNRGNMRLVDYASQE